ncbi:hypothetical protein [Hymenobacter sp. YC55]|uniref:hypothetical protein n=1 Tax=Hymenobacter sp. YC55 TaxID=3034019 RepID=UPI0023F7B65E|nr:hypothetical protein [Hymenobacter sp. YC55]MDF7812731.1 hypothetical protein [Hymenobacter sp. YC55]
MIDLSITSPSRRWLVPGFFVVILVLGLFIFPDYGLSMDEEISRNNGMVTLKHLALQLNPDWVAANPEFERFPIPLAEYFDRDYGVAFEVPVTFLERLLKLDDVRQQFLFRHLCTFLVCFGGIIAVYQLATRRFRDWRIGLLAAGWLVLSPRLFAESFYNDKDAVFMALFAIATNTGVRLLLRPTTSRICWHALACAITIDVRIMGVLLPMATVALLVWRGVLKEVTLFQVAKTVVVYAVLLSGLVVLFWPYLWPSPLENFLAAFEKMSSFRWTGTVLYQGEMVPATDLPWHYAPVWIGITTPILYLGAGLLGILLVVWKIVRQRWRLWSNEQQLQDVLFLGLSIGPLVAVVVLHSVLYDGWRQLYFVYPTFLLLAIRGWVAVLQWTKRRILWSRAWRSVTALSLVFVACQMIYDHPFQNVYFNMLVGPNVMERFELDYWGLGYQQDLAYIAEHDPRSTITVFCIQPTPAPLARMMLPDGQRERLTLVDRPELADYFITSYRGHPEPYPYPEIYQIRADGRRIHSVFQWRW